MAGKSRLKKMKSEPEVLVTGDRSIDRFIYLEGFPDKPANLRDAWVDAVRFWRVNLDGGSGSLVQYLKTSGINAFDPCSMPANGAESIYILTRGGEKKGQKWCIGQAITAGEREYPSGQLSKCDFKKIPERALAVILDFNQGWLANNKDMINVFLQKRTFIVRTHDPLRSEWKNIRNSSAKKGIWFSPVQDMANGSLWFPGNWENLRERILDYIGSDNTIWKKGKWLHYIVIQISYDGILIIGPDISKEGELIIFKGDQPGSFLREGYGTVVAGGIIFLYSLAQALLSAKPLNAKHIIKCAQTGLARIRQVVKEGYIGPDKEDSAWRPPSTTNLPVKILEHPNTTHIITYSKPPAANWENASAIVCGNEDTLLEKTVFRLGKLTTSSPDYAHTLLRLSSRVESHIARGKGILSFSIFGGPGSGKSFVANQVAASVDNPEKSIFEQLPPFNLSQFDDSSRLVDAFKQIQTASLQGKVPFVLWDEFDTFHNGSRAGWISSFLMPMQDGEFFDGMSNRALGKCVFVFMGGIFKDDAEFNNWASSEDGRVLKGPDFHSRLSSSLTVPSVDFTIGTKESFMKEDPAKLVRAVLIRAFLEHYPRLKSISQEVLAFLLHVPLEHGARSLEKIISASELSKTADFEMYHLPPLDVLQLHVDESKIPSHSITEFMNGVSLGFAQLPSLNIEWRG